MLAHRLRAAAGNAGGDGIPTDGLIAHYTMDNISGSTLVDEQGSYDGTITGATAVTGKIGNALSFDGVNDGLSLPANGSHGKKSVSFWMNGSGTDGTYIIYEESSDYNFTAGATLISTSVGTLNFTVHKNVSGYNKQTIPSAPVLDGTWRHVVFTYDKDIAAVNQAKVYIDGVLQSPTSVIADISPNNITNSAAYIGCRNLAAYFSDIDIDLFRIYSRALTQDDVTALFNEV